MIAAALSFARPLIAAHGFGWPDYSNRVRIALNDDFGSGLDPFEDRPYILGQVNFADARGSEAVLVTFSLRYATSGLSLERSRVLAAPGPRRHHLP